LAAENPLADRPRLQSGPRRGRRLVKKDQAKPPVIAAEQRLLLLDRRRSGLPAGDFAALVGLSQHTLDAWKRECETQAPAGRMAQPRGGPKGSRGPDLTKGALVTLKEANPEWGCERISAMLLRGPALPASAGAVAPVLREAGYETEEVIARRH